MGNDGLLHAEVSNAVIRAFYHVYNTLGYGSLEKVYEKALVLTLRKAGFTVETEVPLKVHFEGELVGEYFADVVVAGCVILELKAVEAFAAAHEAQLLNYLKATSMEVGLLLNFGPKAEFRRKVFTNDRKAIRRPAE
jgi:GxxExxY protein